MGSARGIDLRSQVLIPRQAIVKSSEVLGTTTAAARIGESAAPSTDAADFRQRLQAIFDALQVLEQVTNKEASPANGRPGRVGDGTSGPASAAGLRGAHVRDAKGTSKPSSCAAQWSDLPRTNARRALQMSPLDIPSKPNANQPSHSPVGHVSTLDSQKSSGSSKSPATMEATAKSVAAVFGANPEFPPTSAVVPPEALPPQASKPSAHEAALEAAYPIASPSVKSEGEAAILAFNRLSAAPNGDRTTSVATPEAAPDSDPWAASDPTQLATMVTRADVMSDASQSASATPGKVSAEAVHSTMSQQSSQNSSIESSAPELASATVAGMYEFTVAPLDKGIKHGKNPATSDTTVLSASKLEVSQRNHSNTRGAITHSRSRLEVGLSSTQAVSSLSGAEILGDTRTGQFAIVSEAGLLPVHRDGFTVAPNEHLAAGGEPFKAMDAGANDTPATWVRADAHRAEAGFQDPSLGWVSVRAHAGAEGIHAALIPSSDMAGKVLGGHLVGLNAHLTDHHAHLHSITLSTPDTGWNNRDTGRDMRQGNDADTSHDRHQRHMREDRESIRTGSVAHSTHVLRGDPQSVVPLPTFTADPNPRDGHVSFVV